MSFYGWPRVDHNGLLLILCLMILPPLIGIIVCIPIKLLFVPSEGLCNGRWNHGLVLKCSQECGFCAGATVGSQLGIRGPEHHLRETVVGLSVCLDVDRLRWRKWPIWHALHQMFDPVGFCSDLLLQ